MSHAGDRVFLDHGPACGVAPGAVPRPVDARFFGRCVAEPMHINPLPRDRICVRRANHAVSAALPDRDRWPGSAVPRRLSDRAPARAARRGRRAHLLERLLHTPCGAVRQAGEDRSAGKPVRIDREQHGRHRAACRQSADVDALTVEAVTLDHRVDHLRDRQRFAGIAPGVAGFEPVEAEVGIVRPLLLGIEHRETVGRRKLRPTRPAIISSGGLGASVQHDNQRHRVAVRVGRGHELPRLEVPGIRSELLERLQRPVGMPAASGETHEGIER